MNTFFFFWYLICWGGGGLEELEELEEVDAYLWICVGECYSHNVGIYPLYLLHGAEGYPFCTTHNICEFVSTLFLVS